MAPKMRGGIRQRHDRRIREALAAGRPEEEAGEGGLGDVPDLMETAEEGGTGPGTARKKRRQGEKEERGSAEGDKEKEKPAKDYRDCIAKKYLLNKQSASEVKKEMQKAERAGAQGVADLATRTLERNSQRSLMRALLKGCDAPPLYWAKIPVHDPKTSTNGNLVDFPFLLPHEVLYNMLQKSPGLLQSLVEAPLPSGIGQIRDNFAEGQGIPKEKLLGLGIFGDGVPHQKRKSIECFSWNLLGLGVGAPRQLFTCISKEFTCKCGCGGRHTLDEILKVLVWSLMILYMAVFPTKRHDGEAFGDTDKQRKRMYNGPLDFFAALLQVRGDWSWLKQLFGFPSWASKQICWRCQAGTEDHPWWHFGKTATWRNHRCSSAEFFQRQRQQGIDPSPLFGLPGFLLIMVCIDVLHALDLGVTQDLLGNLFWESLDCLWGDLRNKDLRFIELKKSIKEYYKTFKPPTQIDSITQEMVKKEKKPPKLKAKGAETRHLVPFGLQLATEMYAKNPTLHYKTILQAMAHMMDFYMAMSLPVFDADLAARSSRGCCEMFGALAREAARADKIMWKEKPKMHLFRELGEYQAYELGNPAEFWSYKDEDFMGLVSKIAFRRGGKDTPSTTAKQVLDRVRVLMANPEIMDA